MEPTAPEQMFTMPVDLTGKKLSERVQMGEHVAALIEHPGFADLLEVIGLHGDGLVTARIYRPPDSEAASYADLTGHLRGLREFEPIAWGIVENGKQAEAEQRQAEERGV